jgi:metal-responsive CopG/Arc/MetJ family transcriptional regulator
MPNKRPKGRPKLVEEDERVRFKIDLIVHESLMQRIDAKADELCTTRSAIVRAALMAALPASGKKVGKVH